LESTPTISKVQVEHIISPDLASHFNHH